MTPEEIRLGLQKFEELKVINKEKEKVNERIKKLEEICEVREYKSLLESLGISIKVESIEEELAHEAFDIIASKTKNKNEIWVEVGTYDASKFNEATNCILYRNLENKKERFINPLFIYINRFKEENVVIDCNLDDKEDFFNKLRKYYFLSLIQNNKCNFTEEDIQFIATQRVKQLAKNI